MAVKTRRPSWFILLLIVSLLPIILWPLIWFGSVFLFDNPKDINDTFLLFFAVNSYPFVLIINAIVGYRIYPKRKKLAVGLLIIPILLFSYLLTL